MIKNKRGSYLVEAALTLPIFLLAVLMLMSSVPAISMVENAVFSIADEVRLESMKSSVRQNPYILPVKVKGRVMLENEHLERYRTRSYRYHYMENDIEDLLSLKFRITCQGRDPFGLFDHVSFDGTITARAFTGNLHKIAPERGNTEVEIVYIFPDWGMRYHDKSCTYVKGSCQMIYLSQETKKDYKPCDICNAESAQIGSPVFCFQRYGEAYHLAACRTIARYYIQIEKGKAEAQGYSPCSKCGG